MSYTEQDHAALVLATDLMAWASEIIEGVKERCRLDLNMQAVYFLGEAAREAEVAEKEVGMADRYLNWKTGDDAA